MLGNSVAKSDRAMYAAPVRLNSKLSLAVRRGVRVAAAILLSAWLTGVLWAAETKMAGGPMIQRSMRVVPRKFVILPSGATVPINQTQHFGVLDSSGKAVAVRWNVSGLGCYGACLREHGRRRRISSASDTAATSNCDA